MPLDLGDTGQHIGGGDLTKRAWISVKEYSFPELVGLKDSSGDITAEDLNDRKAFLVRIRKKVVNPIKYCY